MRRGKCLSQSELVTAVNAYLHDHGILHLDIDADYVSKVETGRIRWPREPWRRRALRAILHVETDAQIGLYPTRQSRKDAGNRAIAGTNATIDADQLPGAGAFATQTPAPVAADRHVSQLPAGVGRDSEPHEDRISLAKVVVEALRRDRLTGEASGAEDEVQRRVLLQQALAALTGGSVGAIHALEAIRSEVTRALPGRPSERLDADSWGETAWEYGHSYLTTAPDVLIVDLAIDLVELLQAVGNEGDERRKRDLSVPTAQLAALMAMSLTNVSQTRSARRWWRTARQAADASGDSAVRVWVRAEEGIRVLYTQRSPQITVDLADEALAIGGPKYGGKALAGKAQALALMGRPGEAREVIRMIEPVLEQMPMSVVGDERTVYGWPENCLRHTESYVYSHVGDSAQASRAQERALALYAPTELRSRALVELHQAMCMVNDGYLDDGSQRAMVAITKLPAAQRTALVLDIGQRIAKAIPDRERMRPPVIDLREILALPPAGPRSAT